VDAIAAVVGLMANCARAIWTTATIESGAPSIAFASCRRTTGTGRRRQRSRQLHRLRHRESRTMRHPVVHPAAVRGGRETVSNDCSDEKS